MNFDFLTPEIFDMLVIANLIVALFLIAFRFYQDVRYAETQARNHREQNHDESSYNFLDDTDTNYSQLGQNETKQQSQNQ